LVNLAYGNLAGGTLVSSAIAALFALGVQDTTAETVWWGWLGSMTSICVFGLCLAANFKRHPPQTAALGRSSRLHAIVTTLTGIAWGASVWIFPTIRNSGELGVAHILVLAGLAVVAARRLTPLRNASMAYLVVIMVRSPSDFLPTAV